MRCCVRSTLTRMRTAAGSLAISASVHSKVNILFFKSHKKMPSATNGQGFLGKESATVVRRIPVAVESTPERILLPEVTIDVARARCINRVAFSLSLVSTVANVVYLVVLLQAE